MIHGTRLLQLGLLTKQIPLARKIEVVQVAHHNTSRHGGLFTSPRFSGIGATNYFPPCIGISISCSRFIPIKRGSGTFSRKIFTSLVLSPSVSRRLPEDKYWTPQKIRYARQLIHPYRFAIFTENTPYLNVWSDERLGPIVRIAPNEYSIDDPEAIRHIYGHGTNFVKVIAVFIIVSTKSTRAYTNLNMIVSMVLRVRTPNYVGPLYRSRSEAPCYPET